MRGIACLRPLQIRVRVSDWSVAYFGFGGRGGSYWRHPHLGKGSKKHPKNWETALWGKVRLYWKKSFIERKALLKERLYWKKGLIETNSKIWPNSKIWSKFWNLVEILKFGQIFEILPKTWNLVEILKFGWNLVWKALNPQYAPPPRTENARSFVTFPYGRLP